MNVRLTYVHHNSFVLECAGRALLFDLPSPEHLPAGARQVMERAISGRDLFVFASHGHADHFDPDTPNLVSSAASAAFIYADDIPDMYEEATPPGALVVEPDERYSFHGLDIRTFLSNDLGVAFFVALPTPEGLLRVWHGGDLACWDWPEAAPQERTFTREFFGASLDRLEQALDGQTLHVAFQDTDQRLPGLAGGPLFLQRLRPVVFAPMHSFGDMAFVRGLGAVLAEHHDPDQTRLFVYDTPGTEAVFQIALQQPS